MPRVMKRRRYLSQSLQKCLLWLLRPQPHDFPGFMRCKELTRIIPLETFSKRPLGPIEFHQLLPPNATS